MITRRVALPFSLLLAALLIPSASANKTENWVEVRSPNFHVASNAGEKKARETAAQFEKIRAVFRQALPALSTHASPVVTVLAVKDEKSLRELLPEYWATKGHMHPAGVFYEGMDKYYIVVRTDISSEDGYETVYHEYFHSISMPYYPNLPLWLAEGLAEFYGHTHIDGNNVKLGQADPGHLQLLQEQRMLPFDTLFRADQSSPYYNEQNRASVFYAESWAVGHYFMLGDKTAHRPQLVDYLKRVDRGVPQDQAAREAFGDLAHLEKQLQNYVRKESFYQVVMKVPTEIDEKGYPAHPLSPAESAALRGDSFVCRFRAQEAQPLLEEALRLDSKNAQAHESMGFVNFIQGKPEDAARWFTEAIDLDSHSYLVYYYRAMLNRVPVLDETSMEQTEKDLRRAIELNPNFAPAYGTLASFEVRHPEKLSDALELAKKAISLEPGNVGVQLNYGTVLMLTNHMQEAETIARRAQQAARDPQERAMAAQFLASLEQYRNFASETRNPRRTPTETGAAPQPPETASEDSSGGTVPPETTRRAPDGGLGPGNAEGEIAAVSCQERKMNLDLNAGSHPLHLHANDFTQIAFMAQDWTPPDHFDPCRDLKGLHARIRFTPVPRQGSAGEIVSIEIRK